MKEMMEVAQELTTMKFTAVDLLDQLQEMLTDFEEEKKKWGMEDRVVEKKFYAMLACKEMVEGLIGMPVNLRKDGKVTVGF